MTSPAYGAPYRSTCPRTHLPPGIGPRGRRHPVKIMISSCQHCLARQSTVTLSVHPCPMPTHPLDHFALRTGSDALPVTTAPDRDLLTGGDLHSDGFPRLLGDLLELWVVRPPFYIRV